MCIAIYQPKGHTLSKKRLQACWKANPDGAGLVYAHKGELVIAKTLTSFKKFYSLYRTHIINGPGSTTSVLVHFRIGTAGYLDEANCHPHRVTQKLAFIHNGILDIDMPPKSPISDTLVFNQTILQKLPENFLKDSAMRKLIAGFLGISNKLAFIDALGQVTLINASAGIWDKDVWYSNGTYQPWGERFVDRWGDSNWEKYNAPANKPLYCQDCGAFLSPREKARGLCNVCWEDWSQEADNGSLALPRVTATTPYPRA